MKHTLTALAVMSVLLAPNFNAIAEDKDPPPDPGEITSQAIVTNATDVKVEVEEEGGDGGPDGASPNRSTDKTVGTWTIRYANAINWGIAGNGTRYVRHEYAQTRRLAGSGAYQAEAHATLIKGSSYSGEQVFSYLTHSCAQKIVNNTSAITCVSPWFESGTGGQKWLVVSGHYFDIAINGSKDSTCDGCIDWIFTTP